jgi:hypothetical protein
MFVIGNIIYDIRQMVSNTSRADQSTYRAGVGVSWYNTGKVYVINNIIHNTAVGISGLLIGPAKIINNIITGQKNESLPGYQTPYQIIMTANSTSPVMSQSIFSNNLFYQSSGDYHAYFAPSIELNSCLQQDPMFINESNADFRLLQNSPAIDAGIASDAYNTFYELFGIDIKKDIEGRARPQGAGWDIGAFEYGTGGSVNQAPFVNAGLDRAISINQTASLVGSVSDDGLPNPPGKVTVTWSKVSGAGDVTFSGLSLIDTTARFSSTGTYIMRLTASDGLLSAHDTMRVFVSSTTAPPPPAINQPPVIHHSIDTLTINLPAAGNLSATVDDDGLPDPPGKVVLLWSTVSGPGTVIFGSYTDLDTTIACSAAGTYIVRLTADDGALKASKDITIVAEESAVKSQAENNVIPLVHRLVCQNNVIAKRKNLVVKVIVDVKEQGAVSVIMYDSKGAEIKVLMSGEQQPGSYPIFWDGKDASGNAVGSGIYIVHMKAGSFKEIKKIAVVK